MKVLGFMFIAFFGYVLGTNVYNPAEALIFVGFLVAFFGSLIFGVIVGFAFGKGLTQK